MPHKEENCVQTPGLRARRRRTGIQGLSYSGVLIFYVLIWTLPLIQHPFWGGYIGPLSVFEYLGLFSLLYALVQIVSAGKIPPIFSYWPLRLFFLLYLVAIVSAFATNQSGTRFLGDSLLIYTSSMFLVVITVTLVDTLEKLRWTILVIIGSYAWASLYLIREWQLGSKMSAGFRPGWIVSDSNLFSTAAIFAIALAFYFMRGEGPRWERYYCGICLLLMLVGTTLCASRGGFLGLVTACALLAWRTKNRIRNLGLIMILVLPLSLLLPVSPLQRFLHPSIAETGSEEAHQEAWKAGLRMIEAHPLTGIGLGNFKPLMPQYVDPGVTIVSVAHNMFIEVAAELGLPALLIFVAIFIFSYLALSRIRKLKSSPKLVRKAASALQAGLLGFVVAGCFVSAEYQKTSWMGFAILASLFPLAQPKKSKGRHPDQTALITSESPSDFLAAGVARENNS